MKIWRKRSKSIYFSFDYKWKLRYWEPRFPTKTLHYENKPIQIYGKFNLQKNWKFSDKKNSDIFHISAQNIDYGYSLEPPRRGGSNEYHNLCFLNKN